MILDIEECLNEIGTWYSEKPTEFGLQNIESYFVNSGIRSVSGKLFGLSNRYKGYKSVASSFYNLIRGIIDLIEQYHEPDIVDRVKRKWKKIIVAYFNIILFNQMYEHIKEIYFGIGGNNTNADDYGGNKKVLAVGLINIEEDDIYVNREIQRIVELSIGTNYYVYPRVACTISAFENLVKKYNFDIVHLAGHTTDDNKLAFVDENITARRFENIFLRNQKNPSHIVYNCCNSEAFYTGCTNLGNSVITYDMVLYLPIPYNFSEIYYQSLFIAGASMFDAYNNANIDEHYIFH